MKMTVQEDTNREELMEAELRFDLTNDDDKLTYLEMNAGPKLVRFLAKLDDDLRDIHKYQEPGEYDFRGTKVESIEDLAWEIREYIGEHIDFDDFHIV